MPFNLNAVKLITNNELWFAKPNTQNDPNEAEFILKYDEKINVQIDLKISIEKELEVLALGTNCGKNSLSDSEREKFEKELKKVIRGYLGICSMSVKCDDILMWAHYADNNEGICVVFDKEILINSVSQKSGKVNYSTNISKANFNISGNQGQLLSDRIFFMEKLVNWKDEEEFRFVKRFDNEFPINHNDRLKSFNDKAIVGIILGEKFKLENFKTLINLAYLRNPEKDFYFWRCAKNLYKNSMDIIPISYKYLNFHTNQNDYPFQLTLKWTKAKLLQSKT